jgi:hypothetical protein
MSIRKLFSRRFLASAVTVPLVAGGLVFATPGVAEAVTCGQSWSNKDPGGGTGTGSAESPYTVPLHSGMYGDCRVTSRVSTGIKLWYHCYRRNSYGNTWTHVRIDGTDWKGWVWDEYLNDGGSYYPC